MNIKQRLSVLEALTRQDKPWFCIDVIAEPTQDEWELINQTHADGRFILIFKQDATLGVFMPNALKIIWSGDL